jgi:hypothetical protein
MRNVSLRRLSALPVRRASSFWPSTVCPLGMAVSVRLRMVDALLLATSGRTEPLTERREAVN